MLKARGNKESSIYRIQVLDRAFQILDKIDEEETGDKGADAGTAAVCLPVVRCRAAQEHGEERQDPNQQGRDGQDHHRETGVRRIAGQFPVLKHTFCDN